MYYTLKGTSLNPKNKNTPSRWIQFNVRSWAKKVNPILCTRLQYSWYGVVAFDSEEQAKVFAFNFDNSEDRRDGYNVQWKVIPYRSTSIDSFRKTDTKYGECYTRIGRA